MRRHERWIVSCAVLWLSACHSTLRHPGGLDEPNRQEATVRNRWIGVTRLSGQGCPSPRTAGWTGSPLFPLEYLERDLRVAAHTAGLQRFCVYEYSGNPPFPKKLPPEISENLLSAGPDRVALSGMGTLGEITGKPFYDRFLGQVQIPEQLSVDGTSRVRLAFLDTQPDGEGFPRPGARSSHGYSLMHTAGHLAGPLGCRNHESPCAIEVASRLALPVVSFDPVAGRELKRDKASGGFRGRITDLGQALLAEVNQWRKTEPSLRPAHLVLNLSVGWDGEKLGGWEEKVSDMPPDVQTVYEALELAADQGILVIAAAGNELGGSRRSGLPLLPGGWEKRRGRTLVYAASGVDRNGHPLVNTRAQGEAPRVAYADHVAVPDLAEPSRYTATLTGSSVAAAVVSTTAAVVWSYRSELTPAEVMKILSRSGEVMATRLESGELLPRRPDFSAAPDVRRISLCKAVCEACSGARCPRPECKAAPGDSLNAKLRDFEPARRGILGPISSSSPGHPDLRENPGVGPQTGVDPCPNCAVKRPNKGAFLAPSNQIALVSNAPPHSSEGADLPDNGALLIEIPRDWPAGTLKKVTLKFFPLDPRTGRKMPPRDGRSIVTPPSLVPGDTLEVPFRRPDVPFQATLSFVLDLGTTSFSIESPLVVD